MAGLACRLCRRLETFRGVVVAVHGPRNAPQIVCPSAGGRGFRGLLDRQRSRLEEVVRYVRLEVDEEPVDHAAPLIGRGYLPGKSRRTTAAYQIPLGAWRSPPSHKCRAISLRPGLGVRGLAQLVPQRDVAPRRIDPIAEARNCIRVVACDTGTSTAIVAGSPDGFGSSSATVSR